MGGYLDVYETRNFGTGNRHNLISVDHWLPYLDRDRRDGSNDCGKTGEKIEEKTKEERYETKWETAIYRAISPT